MLTRSKRTMAAMVGLALLGSVLPGCGGASEGGGGKKLDVLIAVNTQYPEEQKAWFTSTAAAFKEQTGADIVWETFASASDELTKIQTSVVSGTGPDIYAVGTTFTPTAYSTGAFVTLGDTEWKALGGKDKFVPASLGISGPDAEHQIGVPFASRPFVMAYNTDLLKAAGITKPATTWDELTRQAKQLTKNGHWGLSAAYKDNFDPWKLIWAMSVQAGNPIVDGKTARVDDPATIKAYQTYFEWMTKDKVVDPSAVGWSNAQAMAAFAEGKTGYFLMTSALARKTLDSSAVKGKYAFALMPVVPPGATSRPSGGVEAASILSGDNLVVADYTQDKDLAFQLVKMLTDEKAQKEQYELFGYLPVNVEAGQSLTSEEQLAPVFEALAKSTSTPFTGAWAEIQLALTNAVVQSIPDLANGSISDAQIRSRVDTAQQAAQAALSRAK